MGNAIAMPKDGTAQGIAKVRHYETMLPVDQRLYTDPYAHAMYPGSRIQEWMGTAWVENLYEKMGLKGLQEMISIRTKWLDDQIIQSVYNNVEKDEELQLLLILGAGYDTRGFRLDVLTKKDKVTVLEVDQPQVQTKKLANLQWLIDKKQCQEILDRMNSKQVQFLPVNFNEDSLEEKLKSHDGFQQSSPPRCVLTLEGVTQYIPKESTAETLKALQRVVASGSTLLITYVDQKCLDDPSTLPTAFRRVQGMAAKVGEPWISGWTPDEFKSFLHDCGYKVISDSTTKDYNEKYLEPVGRKMEETELLSMERYVVAHIL